MSDMKRQALLSTEERQEEQITSDTRDGARPSDEEATFILHILRQTRGSATSEVDWERAAAATGLRSAAAAHGKYGDLQVRLGWRIPQDAQLGQLTDKRNPTAKTSTKVTVEEDAEDTETDNSEGGVKINIQKETERPGGEDWLLTKEFKLPTSGEDWLLTKEFTLPTRHPASRGPTSGRLSPR